MEFFPYRAGMLVWLVDDAYADNNTSAHPGGGAALPVDSFAAPFTYPDGTRPSNRRQPFDATFGLGSNPETCLHKEVLVGNGKNQAVQTVAACAAGPRAAGDVRRHRPAALLVVGQPAELGQGRRASASPRP